MKALEEYWSRIADAYHYNSGRWLFPLCGFAKKWAGELDDDSRAQQVSYVLHITLQEWRTLCYRPLAKATREQRQFCGGSISTGQLTLTRPRVCPKCLRERPIWWAVWDLALLVACPVHGIMLIDTCARCGRALSWRPAPDRCICGYDLSAMRTVRASKRLIALSAAIYAAVGFKQEACKSEIEPVTFPAEIHGLKLDSLLYLVRFLASTRPDPVGRDDAERTDLSTAAKVADAAARVLQNWPRELYRNLGRRIPARVSKSADLSPRIVFGVLYRRLLKELHRDTFKFLHDVIDEFVIRNWKGPIYGAKPHFSMGTRGQLKWYTLTQARKIARKSLRAMKQLVGSGAVKSKTLRDAAGHERIFFERQSLENLLNADQPHVCYSEVKQFLGLANYQTLSLAKAGIIRCERSGDIDTRIDPKDRYLLEDVLAIKESFASTRAQAADSRISPAIIRSVMLNRIQPITQFNDSPGIMAYAFRVDDLTPFKRETSTGVEIAPPGYMKYGEAAGVIGVERHVIGQLVTHGHLTAVGQNGRAKLLRSADVRRFAAKYVPLAAAARVWNITSESLVSSLESSSIPYLNIPTYFYKKPTLLIPCRACAKVSKSL